jgi:hypothetical protein
MMFQKKKPVPDPEDLERFRKEAQVLQQVEDGLKTPFGKYILTLLGEYKLKAVSEFSNKPITDMDDIQTMAWTYSIRGKIQLLNDIEKQLLSARENKEALIKELKQYSV